MEKTFNDCGLSVEEIAEIMTDMIREIASRLDLRDVMTKVKEKYPAVTEEQWDKLLSEYRDIPDIRDMDVLNGFLEEMNIKELLTNLYQQTLEDETDDEPENEE